MQIIEKNINDIIMYKNNPRKNDEAVPYVAESIKQFGFKVPIIIDSNNIIVCGHTRYKAAKRLKLKTVPCIIADDLSDEQIKAFRLADNKVAEFAEWDLELLKTELEEIADINMSEFAFDLDDLMGIEKEQEVVEDDFEEDLPENPISKVGDIYQLGNHRLMVGDSTDLESVQELMNGEKADCVMTDPPYNVAVSNSKGMTIMNDDMNSAAFKEFLVSAFQGLSESLKKGGSFYVWLAGKERVAFETALNENNLFVRQELIWNKNTFNLGRQDYQWKHEPCLYGWKEGASHYFVDDRTQATVIEDEKKEFKKMRKEELVQLLEDIYSDKISTTVINESKPTINDLHPTMKPLKLIGRLLKNSSKINDNILDLFGGSGSTLIVCEQLKRNCFMMEYDPKYADVIIERWEKFTGKKAVKIN